MWTAFRHLTGEDGRTKDSPSEHDCRDLVERDERRLLRDEQELAFEEVQLAFVRLEVALDGGLAIVAVHEVEVESQDFVLSPLRLVRSL